MNHKAQAKTEVNFGSNLELKASDFFSHSYNNLSNIVKKRLENGANS